MENLRNAWFDTTDLATRQVIRARIQQPVWQDGPYIPLDQAFGPYPFNRRVTDVVKGFPLLYGLRVACSDPFWRCC